MGVVERSDSSVNTPTYLPHLYDVQEADEVDPLDVLGRRPRGGLEVDDLGDERQLIEKERERERDRHHRNTSSKTCSGLLTSSSSGVSLGSSSREVMMVSTLVCLMPCMMPSPPRLV